MVAIWKRLIRYSSEAETSLTPCASLKICREGPLVLPLLLESKRMKVSMLKKGNKRFEVLVLLGAKNEKRIW